MLPDQADLCVVLRRVFRIAILQREAVRMVDIDVAIWHVMHEKRPEEVPQYYRVGSVLAALDDVVKGSNGIPLRAVARPVVLSDQVGLVGRHDQSYIFLKLGVVGWVVVIREDVDRVDGEMSPLDTVRAVDHELFGGKLLDEGLEWFLRGKIERDGGEQSN